MTKKLKIEIEWKLLEKIARYYNFPSAVFLGNTRMFARKPPKIKEDLSFCKICENNTKSECLGCGAEK